MSTRNKLLIAMLATSLFACNDERQDQVPAEKEMIIDGKKFQTVLANEVVVKDENSTSAALIKDQNVAGIRSSLYFIKDSSVITIFSPTWHPTSTGLHSYKEMVGFEKQEFAQAKAFAEQKPIVDSATYYKEKYQKLTDSLQNK